MELTATEQTALNHVASKSDALSPGEYHVDTLVRIRADFYKGEEYFRKSTSSIPLKQTLALFIKHCGITREAALTKLELAMKESLQTNQEVDFGVLEEAQERVESLLTSLPQTRCTGKTTFRQFLVEKVAS
jgi:hypothetical protein